MRVLEASLLAEEMLTTVVATVCAYAHLGACSNVHAVDERASSDIFEPLDLVGYAQNVLDAGAVVLRLLPPNTPTLSTPLQPSTKGLTF